MSVSVVALLACHNRRELTLASLASLFAQESDCAVRAVVVDDGCSDGTGEAALECFGAAVELVRGDGTLFWAGGMARAEAHAVQSDPDYVLWLNDDVVLAPHALGSLLQTSSSAASAIAVGAVADPTTRQITYTGLRRIDRHPMHFRPMRPTCDPSEVDTFNGNVVLVPRSVYLAVGGIDGAFGHALADLDYALRARRLGFRALLAPSIVGTCSRRDPSGSWRDRSLDPASRWRSAFGPKGVPPRATARYLRRHGGPLWWVFWSLTYLKLAAETGGAAVRSCLGWKPKRADDTTRVARRDHSGRDIGRDDAPGADDAALSDSYAFQDD
jgi:GT2 family glycosyltransferase